MVGGLARAGGVLGLFGALSLAAVLIGAFVCASSGVPAALWIRNLAAWGVGALAAVGLAAAWRPGALPVALWLAPLGLAATLVSADLQGVHRWIEAGPVRMNAAMLLLPAASVALAALAGTGRGPWIAALLSLGLLAAQPDASQATTLAAVMALVAATRVRRPGVRMGLIVAAGALAALAWLRPDPLAPVPEVEGIVELAFAVSLAAGGAAALLLVATAAAPAVVTARGPAGARLAGLALSLCLLCWAGAPLLGAFPVPFVGIGLSPILGGWLGAGMLAGLVRREQP